MRVIFMGTPDFSVPVLDALVEAGHEIAAVYCQPSRPAGRGKKERASPVQLRAEALGLDVRYPVNFKDEADMSAFAALHADIAVVVAYGLILPQALLDAPRFGCLNIHASLLPRWRGAAPIHRAIMAGDQKTGICVMQMDRGLDTGAVLMRRETVIGAEETTASLHDRLSRIGAEAIIAALAQLPDLTPVAQAEDGVSYAAKIDKSEARIDWSLDAETVDRKIRGLSPFPGAWSELDGARIKLLASRLGQGEGAQGEVLDQALTVGCARGSVQVLRLQRAGRGAMEADAFIRGTGLPVGATFI
ncbi:MAG: methionyl-tRNA formyltransferase [Alphaproteobacteria bacterium]|nr:methionyl-tRNA formyltransferase [Alphaproteobacteria bacterium]